MTRTIILHIGTEKTGTTSIQAVSAINRDLLTRHGILYPRTPGNRNHIKLTLFASDGTNLTGMRRNKKLRDDEAYGEFKQSFTNELRAEIAGSDCSIVYFSNEHLSSRLHDRSSIERLASVLRPFADKVKIVIYLRPQHELYLSSYSTKVKTGHTDVPRLPENDNNSYYNYDLMLAPWADVFGDEAISVRIFDRKKFVGNDLIKDFFSTMNFAPDGDFVVPRDWNKSLDRDTLEFLRLFNMRLPRVVDDEVNSERGDIARALVAIADGPKLYASEQDARDIIQLFRPSNARVAQRYLGRSDGILFDNARIASGSPFIPLTVERAVEIAAHIWRWKQQQLIEARGGSDGRRPRRSAASPAAENDVLDSLIQATEASTWGTAKPASDTRAERVERRHQRKKGGTETAERRPRRRKRLAAAGSVNAD